MRYGNSRGAESEESNLGWFRNWLHRLTGVDELVRVCFVGEPEESYEFVRRIDP